MITPRTTRLLRTPGLRAFHRAIALAAHGPTIADVRDTLIVVSSSGAVDQLRRTLEELWLVERWRPSDDECAAVVERAPVVEPSTVVERTGEGADNGRGAGRPARVVEACVWPQIVTRAGLYRALHERLDDPPPLLDDYAREVLFQRAAADAVARGDAPPFEVRPGLIPEMLSIYDALRRQHRLVDDFERLVGGALEAGAEIDRGARRLLQQTRFLVSAFRAYEARLAEGAELDEHGLRARLLERPSARPIRRVIVTVPDQRADTTGLWPADFDLLTRLDGLEAIDLVATESLLATGYLERVFETLPEIDVRVMPDAESPAPLLLAPAADGRQDPLHFTSRDREQELADVARRLTRRGAEPPPRDVAAAERGAEHGPKHEIAERAREQRARGTSVGREEARAGDLADEGRALGSDAAWAGERLSSGDAPVSSGAPRSDEAPGGGETLWPSDAPASSSAPRSHDAPGGGETLCSDDALASSAAPDSNDARGTGDDAQAEALLAAPMRAASLAYDRMAVVYQRPLPYLYLARQVFGAFDLPWQAFDALPLAAEPYAAALDLVITFALSDYTRAAGIALLRSSQFRVAVDGQAPTLDEIAACDAELRDAGFLGGRERLHALRDQWRRERSEREGATTARERGTAGPAGAGPLGVRSSGAGLTGAGVPGAEPGGAESGGAGQAGAGVGPAYAGPSGAGRGGSGRSGGGPHARSRGLRALEALVLAADALQPLEASALPSVHLDTLQAFLSTFERRPFADATAGAGASAIGARTMDSAPRAADGEKEASFERRPFAGGTVGAAASAAGADQTDFAVVEGASVLRDRRSNVEADGADLASIESIDADESLRMAMVPSAASSGSSSSSELFESSESFEHLLARHRRARAAVVGTIGGLRFAFAEHGEREGPFRDLAALLHRWLEGQTFNPRVGESGLHLVDVQAAMYGRFTHVALVGVVEGEWPTSSSRSIFYPTSLLRDLGWPTEPERRAAARAVFDDLLRLARDEVSVSAFALEHDAIVRPSPFVEDLAGAGLRARRDVADVHQHGAASSAFSASSASGIHVDERLLTVPALTIDPREIDEWTLLRAERSLASERAFHGWTGTMEPRAYSVTGLDRYLQCPFKYFAASVLRLEEEPDRRPGLTPLERGRFEHEVFQRFFERWDRAGRGAIDESSLEDARAEFVAVVDDVLARLPAAERELERTRLLGSAVSAGLGERVFRFEAARLAPIAERLLEYSLDGEYELSASVPVSMPVTAVEGADTSADTGETSGAREEVPTDVRMELRTRRVRLRGIADRIDLLADGTMRVIDYKTGKASTAGSSIQLPVYAHCAEQRLDVYRGRHWRVSEAGYLAFGRPEPFVPVVTGGDDAPKKVTQAIARVIEVVDRIEEGTFPVTPVEPHMCIFCGFAAVCRKDYVDDE